MSAETVPQRAEHDHDPASIRQRLYEGPKASVLRDWVYGGIDGVITTFAIVAGAVGGSLSDTVIIILGLSNLVADGLSMAAANFAGTRAEADNRVRLRAVEERHIDTDPEGERMEIREIYRFKGFDGTDLDRVVDVITSDRERWIATMLSEEYGLPDATPNPWRAAATTFAAFVVCGFVPIAPYLFRLDQALALSVALTGVTFFAVGAAKSAWSVRSPIWGGLETFAIGTLAAGAAYGIGRAAEWLIA